MTRPLIALDLETNGLDVDRHHAWEVAWWNLTTGERDTFLPWISDDHDFLAAADLTALRVNRFIDRWTPERLAAEDYSSVTAKKHLLRFLNNAWPDEGDNDSRAVMVCAQPKFDLPFTSKTLAAHGVTAAWAAEPTDRTEPWHYRAVDFSSWVGSALHLPVHSPLSASGAARMLGVEIPPEQRHTAEGDVTLIGRAMLLLEWLKRERPGFAVAHLGSVLSDAPHDEEIDKLIG